MRASWAWLLASIVALGLAIPAIAQTQTQPSPSDGLGAQPVGPIRLRASPLRPSTGAEAANAGMPTRSPPALATPIDASSQPLPYGTGYVAPQRLPDEFERFASDLAGLTPEGRPARIRRFGSELFDDASAFGDEAENSPLVPADYIVKPGDDLAVAIWGAVDAELNLQVDRSGRITIPRVGSIMVAGTRYGDLPDVLRQRVGRVFRNFELSVSLGQLRGLRVFVTGFVRRPGAQSVSGLATLSQALLRAGGPSNAGSFREITLRRRNEAPVSFDLYDLLIRGSRLGDRVLQADDVIHVGPVGTQVALIGSVNVPAVYELRFGETLKDLLQMAGGATAVADRSRIALERLDERNSLRVVEQPLPAAAGLTLLQGDVVRVFSAVAAVGSQVRQNKRVRVEGEVANAGVYVLPPGSDLNEAIAAAGGLTPMAYLYATELQRESVRAMQQANYDRALRDMEADYARAATAGRASTADEAAAQGARSTAVRQLIERLRELRPTGRVVLELTQAAGTLPPLLVEDGDRIVVPSRPMTVGIFGSVFGAGSYLHRDGRSLDEYLRLAGGPTRGADTDSVFVIRANGTVASAQQDSGWFTFKRNRLVELNALPGDTIFVPELVGKPTLVQNLKDWAQILSQFGLGAAALKTLSN